MEEEGARKEGVSSFNISRTVQYCTLSSRLSLSLNVGFEPPYIISASRVLKGSLLRNKCKPRNWPKICPNAGLLLFEGNNDGVLFINFVEERVCSCGFVKLYGFGLLFVAGLV